MVKMGRTSLPLKRKSHWNFDSCRCRSRLFEIADQGPLGDKIDKHGDPANSEEKVKGSGFPPGLSETDYLMTKVWIFTLFVMSASGIELIFFCMVNFIMMVSPLRTMV